MSGSDRRLDVVVVVGRDSHELRALDQEGRVPEEREAHLVGLELGEFESCGRDARPVGGDEAGAVAPHFGLGDRRLGGRLLGAGNGAAGACTKATADEAQEDKCRRGKMLDAFAGADRRRQFKSSIFSASVPGNAIRSGK